LLPNIKEEIEAGCEDSRSLAKQGCFASEMGGCEK
jgi:hypothetical protein